MKTVVDVLRCGQEWIPETEEQINYVVLGFGGAEITVPVDEETLAKVIAHTKHNTYVAEEPEPPPVSQDRVFRMPPEDEQEVAGDEEVIDPLETALFAPPEAVVTAPKAAPPQELNPAVVRREQIAASRSGSNKKLAELRQRAKSAPGPRPRTLAKDDMGYPLGVEPVMQVPTTPRHGGIEVVHHAPAHDIGADDDGFGQG